MDYEIVYNDSSILGEGPTWDEMTQRLFWIDGLGKQAHIFDPASDRNVSFHVPQPVGSIALTNKAGVILAALQDGVYTLNTNDGTLKPYLMLEEGLPGNRFNDGKCDCMGRFWFGSMNTAANSGNADCAATGCVYSLSANRKLVKAFSDVTISNGMGWDRANRQFYYIDSPQHSVWAFDFDSAKGTLANRRVAIDLKMKEGELPDGMTVDSEGMLWVAIWGGYRVCRFDPRDGSCLTEVFLPVKNVTSCAFGGEHLDDLYVTSSNIEAEGTKKELAGALFRVKTKVAGTRSHRFVF